MTEPHISFVIPLYNEAEVFATLVERMNTLTATVEEACEVILVDDGSSDSTRFLMEEVALSNPTYQCILLSRNFGHQNALTAGLDAARGAYVMVLDADLQDPPELFFPFYEKLQEGYDVVYGVRQQRKENIIKRTAYDLFYKVLSRMADYPIPRDSGDFCLMSRRVVRAICMHREESRFIRGLRNWVGFRQIGLPYERQARAAGEPKYTFSKLFQLASDGIFNFSRLPIKLLTYAGVFCITLSSVYALITLVRKYYFDDVPTGFTALIILITLFGGFQFVSMGILGEYLYRAFFQVKSRPIYIIEKKISNQETHYE